MPTTGLHGDLVADTTGHDRSPDPDGRLAPSGQRVHTSIAKGAPHGQEEDCLQKVRLPLAIGPGNYIQPGSAPHRAIGQIPEGRQAQVQEDRVSSPLHREAASA